MSINRQSDRPTRLWSYAIWGFGFLVFLLFEILGLLKRGPLKGKVPWFTLSETVWALERWAWPVRVALLGAGVDVLVHLLFGTPLLPV